MKTITAAVLLAALILPAHADHKPKEYPLHGKVTSTGKVASGTGYDLKGTLFSTTTKTLSITISDGTIYKITSCGGTDGFTPCSPVQEGDHFPTLGEKVDFRIDAKQNHLWIHWIKITCTSKAPCTNFGDGGGEKKEMETEYDIIEVTAPPTTQ